MTSTNQFKSRILYASRILQPMVSHITRFWPSLKTTTHRPPTKSMRIRISHLLLLPSIVSNAFNVSSSQLGSSKPEHVHAARDGRLIFLNFPIKPMSPQQSSRSTTSLLFISKRSSLHTSLHFRSIQKESGSRERWK